MQIKYILGKRPDSRGRVELSVRLRCGSYDRQTGTNIRVEVDRTGDDGSLPQRIVKMLRSLTDFIEESWWNSRRTPHADDWLAETVDRFRLTRIPAQEGVTEELATLIDDYILATDTGSYSMSRTEGYALLRRSVLRCEAWR